MLEKHMRDEISRQMDSYAEAYRKVDSCERRIAALLIEVDALKAEQTDAARLMEIAEGSVNALIEDIDDDAERSEVLDIVSSALSGVIARGMVVE